MVNEVHGSINSSFTLKSVALHALGWEILVFNSTTHTYIHHVYQSSESPSSLQVTASRLQELEQERLQMQEERELMSRQQDAMREESGPRELRTYPKIPLLKYVEIFDRLVTGS